MTRFIVAFVIGFAVLTGSASAAQTQHYFPKTGHACKAHYVRKQVKVRERRHGKWVKVKRAECIAKPKAKVKPKPITTAAAKPVVRATIDPSYTQDPSDNLKVTWTYSAADTSGDLPDGTLSLSVQEPNAAGSSGGCSMDVGANVTGGTCTQELPHYGSWNVTVSYVGASTTVAPATSTDTEDIEPLRVAPVAPVATTTSLSVGAGTYHTEQGPPPENWVEYYGPSTIDMASSDPSNPGFALSLTITSTTNTQTISGAPVTVDECALVFTKTVGLNVDPSTSIGGCGIPDTKLATGDTLNVSATSAASPGYLPATSSTVAVVPPWTL
jgi:hypothetical protein